MFKLLNHYRVMTTKVKIDKISKLLNHSWLSFEKNSKMEDAFGIKGDTNSLLVEETEYRINGQLVPFSTLTFDGAIQAITVKNSDLFGDEEATLQQFDQEEEEKTDEALKLFVDMLSIDADGIISVQADVGRRVKIKQNDNWNQGVVSRITVDKMCIVFGDDDLFSFQWIAKDYVSNEVKLVPFSDEREISEFDFAARAGRKDDTEDLSNLMQLTFDDVNAFRIPPDLFIVTAGNVDAVHIYAKPKGKDLKYHRIKTVAHQFGSWYFPRYDINEKDPVRINEVVNVHPFSESLKRGGKFAVTASSGIIISESGVINASECGLMKNSQYPKQHGLKLGGFIGDTNIVNGSKNETKSGGAGGGIIHLCADDDVVNEGAFLCKASDDRLFSGGSVSVASGGVFDNEGVIDCGKDGVVKICCAALVNNGQITPIPSVVIWNDGSQDDRYQNGIENGKEEAIELEVVGHRGHYGSKHIKNVLEKGRDNYYDSDGHGPPGKDWFIFAVKSQQRFIPTSVCILNINDGRALKRIAIAGSTGFLGEDFVDWIDFDGIRQRIESDPLQKFPVDPSSAYMAWKRGFTSFKVNVLENHGSNYNIFYEFRMNGIYCD